MNRNQSFSVPFEFKGLSNREFEGHGSTFGNVDLGGDIVLPGAFTRSLENHKKSGTMPQMLWMHNPEKLPGKWLNIQEDSTGLAVHGRLVDTPLGNEIYTLMKEEIVRTMSIGYQTVDRDYDKEGNRLLKEIDLWEVSPVSFAMNPLAQIAHVKSRLSERGEYVPTVREFERSLRDAGCSWDVAKRIIAKVYDGELRDEETVCTDSHREGEQEALDAANRLFEKVLISQIKPINFT